MKRLLSVTLFSGLLTLLRMASGFVIAKAVAVQAGPGGLAMIGQVQSFVTAINGIVTAPVGAGVVRYTAEHREQGLDACAPWWRASLTWVKRLLLVVVPLVVIGAGPLSIWLLGDKKYAWMIIVAGLVLPLSVCNILFASVLNGHQQYKRYIALGMIAVGVATASMLALIWARSLDGALLAAATFTAICGCIMVFGSLRAPWLKWRYWLGQTGKTELSGIQSYMVMSICSAICASVTLIVTRNILINQVGLEMTGLWQAVYKISEVYLGVITMALATYLLPRLSSARTPAAMRTELAATAKIILPVSAAAALCIYLLRDWTLRLLFTEEFLPARDLFALQLLADVVKVASWILAYALLAKKATVWYVGSELFFSTTFPVMVLILVQHFGVQGANIAYLINYSSYLAFLLYFYQRYMK